MIGWHYTSEDCWSRIRYEGLIPYRLSHPSLISQPCPSAGIWLYKEQQRGLSHLGCILWQLENKRTAQLVLLKVQYSKSDIRFIHAQTGVTHWLSLNHDLSNTGMVYHVKAPATIAWNTIPPRRIVLAASYDLIKLVDLPGSVSPNQVYRYDRIQIHC